MNENDKNHLFSMVRSAVAEAFAIDASKVTAESRFKEDLNADSIDIATLLMVLEEELGTQIPEDKAMRLKSVNDVVEFLQSIPRNS